MPASNAPGNGVISGINVTPLVDVMLVLLVIFIVTAKISVLPPVTSAVPLDLPHAAHAGAVPVVLTVTVPLSGSLTVDGAPLTSEQTLPDRVRAALARDPELRAIIRADGGVPHRRVIEVLDRLQGAGIKRVAFAALPDPGLKERFGP